MASFLEKLEIEAFRKGIAPRTKKSLEWFRKRVQNVKDVNRSRLMKDKLLVQRKSATPSFGKMFMYRYDAKHKATLPYFDRYPLIFLLDRAPKGFTGINLHYLPPILRAKLFDKLTSLTSNDRYDATTKLRISYEILSEATRYKEFRPCYKRYLTAHMKSKPVLVPASEWEVVLFLPFDSFKGANRDKVWKESRKIMKSSTRSPSRQQGLGWGK